MIYTIYGRPKVGKTTLALKDAPKGKTAILSADRGLIGIETEGFEIIEDTSIKNINKQVLSKAFLQKHKRIVIDTGTALYQDMLLEISGGGAPSLQHRGLANNAFATLMRAMRGPEVEAIVTCQERMILPTEDWSSDDDDEDITASVTADLPEGPRGILTQMSDMIGRMYIANVDGKSARRLWLAPTPNIVAGTRSKVYKGRPPYLKQPSISRLNELLGWTS